MKRIVRMMGLCALVALAFTSCKKKENNGNLTLKATMPQTVSNGRTWNDGNILKWSENDEIKVLHNGEDKTFMIMSGEENNKTATFDATGEGDFLADLLTNDSVYFAYYPNAISTGDGAKVVIESTQTMNATQRFMTNTYPMFGTNNGDNIVFNSNAGVLRIQLQKDTQATGAVKVGSLELTSLNTNDALAGEVTYTNDYVLNPNGILPVANPSNSIILNCKTPVELTGDGNVNPTYAFDFVLFEGTLAGQFNLKVRNDAGELIGDFTASASGTNPDENNYHIIDRKYVTIMPVKALTGAVIPE